MRMLTADSQTEVVAAGSTACPVCGSGESSFQLYREIDSIISEVPDGLDRRQHVQVRVERCHVCGLWRTIHLSDVRLVEVLYADDSACFEASVSKVRLAGSQPVSSSDELSLLHVKPPARLLDVGCGAGQFLLRAQARGYHVSGLDLDPRSVRFAREELKLEVRCATLEELPANERFDVITLIGVVEHLSQPAAVLTEVRRRLSPHGEILVGVPNAASANRWLSRFSSHEWDMFLEPGHLYHYDIRTLRALGVLAGLSMQRWLTGTMTIRGKIPLLPTRHVKLERALQRGVVSFNLLRDAYAGFLRMLDIVRLGDMLFAVFAVRES